MKIKKTNKKLSFSKATIASLDNRELSQLNGGDGFPTTVINVHTYTCNLRKCPVTEGPLC